MESALPLVTVLRNETVHSIDFLVEEGSCPIPSLGPGGRQLVNLSKIVNICRRRQSTSWLIKVLFNQKLTVMTLEPGNFFEHVQILFKFRINENLLIAEGIKEKNIDIILRLSWNIGFFLGRNIIWSRRKCDPIADALVESPMDLQQTRQKDIKAEKAPESQWIEAKKKWVLNQCSDVAVIPEAIVNSSKRSSLRKEKNPRTEGDHSVKYIEVNPSNSANCRVENGLHQDNDTDAFIQSKAVASPESLFVSVKNVPGHGEAQSIASGIRKTTTTYPPLDRSKHDTFETKMSNSSQMEPSREREMAVQIFITTTAAAAATTTTTTITTSGSLQSMGNTNMNIHLTLPTFQTRTPPTTSF
ncbi:Hypothetical predicted protein [Olea europaea subsp. europaea]|uniref:Uncharacterized protein n=1 Tax=Olea europaea subsp. europaea TaxID=158383 RepID=A0A8S0RPY0_OLEEU|nr:Hypothetical predicted protein [Olea europaea subsp. europaea]